MELSEREAKFVEALLADDTANIDRAYVEAGYSAKTAHSNAHKVYNRPRVQEALALARQDRSKRTQIDADRVLTEAFALYQIARREVDKKPSAPMITACKATLELVGKHVGVQAWKDKVELGGVGGGPLIHRIELVGVKANHGDDPA